MSKIRVNGGPFDGKFVEISDENTFMMFPITPITIDLAGEKAHLTPEEVESYLAHESGPISRWAVYFAELQSGKLLLNYAGSLTADECLETKSLSQAKLAEWIRERDRRE